MKKDTLCLNLDTRDDPVIIAERKPRMLPNVVIKGHPESYKKAQVSRPF